MNIEARLDEVRTEYLRRATGADGDLLRQVQHYTAARCGKMLRPRMLLTAAATLGDQHFASRRTLLCAVAVEMLHNASLLHDDVVDNDNTRRGQPSVNARYSNAIAVLAGDYLLAQLMSLLDEINDPHTSRFVNNTVKAMVQAELLQQESHGVTKPQSHEDLTTSRPHDLTTYLKIIDGKTARLFATAAALGNPQYEDFGLHYGRLFQLRDDIADGEASPHTATLIEQEETILNNLPLRLNLQATRLPGSAGDTACDASKACAKGLEQTCKH